MSKQNKTTQSIVRLQSKEDELLNLKVALKRARNPHLIKRLKQKKSRLWREIERLKQLQSATE